MPHRPVMIKYLIFKITIVVRNKGREIGRGSIISSHYKRETAEFGKKK